MIDRISGKTQLYGLIGTPVGHSGSPAMYNYGFEQTEIDAVYMAFDITEEKTAQAIDTFRLFNMSGNVTMPCKTAAASYMDELTPAAKMVGAINTIVNDEGKLVGHITDGIGFVNNLKNHHVEIANQKFVVIGTGGAATAIQVQLAIEGAASISIFNIKDSFYQKGEETVARIKDNYPNLSIDIFDLNDKKLLAEKINAADCLVNATTVGMGEKSIETPISDTRLFYQELTVVDAIYNPPKTQLLKDAEEKGCTIVGGKGMLLEQGKASFKLFTGKELPTNSN